MPTPEPLKGAVRDSHSADLLDDDEVERLLAKKEKATRKAKKAKSDPEEPTS